MAIIEDAGITSTGTTSAGNQLPQLQEEYAQYRIEHALWDEQKSKIYYVLNENGDIVRKVQGKNKEVILHAET